MWRVILYLLVAPFINAVLFIAKRLPIKMRPMRFRPRSTWPLKYQWDLYPAFTTFAEYQDRSAMDIVRDESHGQRCPKLYATAVRKISKTLGGAHGEGSTTQ